MDKIIVMFGNTPCLISRADARKFEGMRWTSVLIPKDLKKQEATKIKPKEKK